MRVLVTGAAGFIGQELCRQLLGDGLGGRPIEQLFMLDKSFNALSPDLNASADVRIHLLRVDFSEDQWATSIVQANVQIVFHLASLLGGAAELDPTSGEQINLLSPLKLISLCGACKEPVRFVNASSIAVFGALGKVTVNEATPCVPVLSYGTHKLMLELALADATRRGKLDACSLRLPGIVARPGNGEGLMSAFMSQIFWMMKAKQPCTVPVTADGKAWWLSSKMCASNLRTIAMVSSEKLDQMLGTSRVVLMPALHLTSSEVVAALAEILGAERKHLISYASNPLVNRLFASYPPIDFQIARSLGLEHDGSAIDLGKTVLSIT